MTERDLDQASDVLASQTIAAASAIVGIESVGLPSEVAMLAGMAAGTALVEKNHSPAMRLTGLKR
ncbi:MULTISPECIES: hypothetical protein [Sphingomonas]|uniref:hypothetical protein n=1 Tax=Sphingomonas TaxID=13687 RepID=UPI001269BB7C|nr:MULTISPECIES: hypothetical protein [Sphingomonas]